MFEYLIILIILLAISLLIEINSPIKPFSNLKERIAIGVLFFVIGVSWDSFAIWRGHWIFPQGQNLGLTIGYMPVEEYLFILILPYIIIALYVFVKARLNKIR